MRISMGSMNVLASNWPLFMARAGGAVMLALAIVVTDNRYTSGFVGTLGLYAVTEGVLAGITWLRDRRFRLFTVEATTGIVIGLAILLFARSATVLLLLFATRGLILAGVHALQARQSLPKRNAKVPMILAGLCALVSLGFLMICAVSYVALALYARIAGYQALFAGVLVAYGEPLRRHQAHVSHRATTNDYGPPPRRARPLH